MTGRNNESLIIIGAGGHGQVALDIVRVMNSQEDNRFKVVGFLDDDQSLAGRVIMGVQVLGTTAQLSEFKAESIFIAIGNNHHRFRMFSDICEKHNLINIIHPQAVIGSQVKLGKGVLIGPGVIINTGSIIGDNVILNTSCSIDHHNRIENHVHIAPGSHLGGEVSVGEGSLIGIGSTVIPGVEIGKWNIVAAGAVIVSDIGEYLMVGGVPAKQIRKLSRENSK